MIVRKVDDGKEKDGKEKGIGSDVGIEEEWKKKEKVRKEGDLGNRRKVIKVEDIFGDIIIRKEKGRIKRKRIERKECKI